MLHLQRRLYRNFVSVFAWEFVDVFVLGIKTAILISAIDQILIVQDIGDPVLSTR